MKNSVPNRNHRPGNRVENASCRRATSKQPKKKTFVSTHTTTTTSKPPTPKAGEKFQQQKKTERLPANRRHSRRGQEKPLLLFLILLSFSFRSFFSVRRRRCVGLRSAVPRPEIRPANAMETSKTTTTTRPKETEKKRKCLHFLCVFFSSLSFGRIFSGRKIKIGQQKGWTRWAVRLLPLPNCRRGFFQHTHTHTKLEKIRTISKNFFFPLTLFSFILMRKWMKRRRTSRPTKRQKKTATISKTIVPFYRFFFCLPSLTGFFYGVSTRFSAEKNGTATEWRFDSIRRQPTGTRSAQWPICSANRCLAVWWRSVAFFFVESFMEWPIIAAAGFQYSTLSVIGRIEIGWQFAGRPQRVQRPKPDRRHLPVPKQSVKPRRKKNTTQ